MRDVAHSAASPDQAPYAVAEAVFADAKAYLSSREAQQMSESELERELHRRGQELMRRLLQGHLDQRTPGEAAGPVEGVDDVERSQRRLQEHHPETTFGTVQVARPGGSRSSMGAALLRRRPKGLLPAARQELLDPSKVWWGGRRGRLADRPRYSISVSLGVVPLVLPRRGSPSTHRSRGWLRSTRSFRTASAPTQFATRRIRARAWMKQRYWVAPACTSELHHGRGPGTARPFDDAGGDGTQAPPCRRTRPRG